MKPYSKLEQNFDKTPIHEYLQPKIVDGKIKITKILHF